VLVVRFLLLFFFFFSFICPAAETIVGLASSLAYQLTKHSSTCLSLEQWHCAAWPRTRRVIFTIVT
jgi:hypothetical protein